MDTNKLQFIDVFAGAGGLSLGLMQAGWTGLFAVEKSPMAFQTLKYNLVDQDDKYRFFWPNWLPVEPIDIQTLLLQYKPQLRDLKGIPLLAGGPPCQGFSHAGRRKFNDERNRLFEQYLALVDLLQPEMLLIENVQGFTKSFTRTEKGARGEEIKEEAFNADKELQSSLYSLGYLPFTRNNSIKAKEFGVPQLRPRYILIAVRVMPHALPPIPSPFDVLYDLRERFLSEHKLPKDNEVTLKDAIPDLLRSWGDIECIEPKMGRFRQGIYGTPPEKVSLLA